MLKIISLLFLAIIILLSCETKSDLRKNIFRKRKEDVKILNEYSLTGLNKPNGFQYRLRYSIHPEKPHFIFSDLDGFELFILDKVNNNWFCFYRTPLKSDEYIFKALLYNNYGKLLWKILLNEYFSKSHPLEIQDIKFDGQNLFFNAACISYASESDSMCSSFICVDPEIKIKKWETSYLTSNGIFIFYRDYIISSYGFFDEEDFIFIIDKSSGQILRREHLPDYCVYLEIINDNLFVIDYQRNVYEFPVGNWLN